LFLDLFYERPILRDGTLVPYEVVVAELERETAYYWASNGFRGGPFQPGTWSQYIVSEMKFPVDHYDEASTG